MSARFAAKSWCREDEISTLGGWSLNLGLVDRYLARNIAVPLIGTLILLPVIIGYFSLVHWLFRGKVRAGETYH